MSLTLFFMSLMLYAQSESFTFEENVKTGKITNWNYQGQIIVITCSGYAKISGFYSYKLYVLPENQGNIPLPDKLSLTWQRLPFVRKKYTFKVRCPRDKVYIYDDVRKICFSEYNVCIQHEYGMVGSVCELVEIQTHR